MAEYFCCSDNQMGFWAHKKEKLPTAYPSKPVDITRMGMCQHPRWMPVPNAQSFTQRIPFNPGAPAFTYNQYGPLEYPVLAGYNNRQQFKSMQPPATIYGQAVLRQGLGQSWTAQPPTPFVPASQMFTQTQLAAMTNAVLQPTLSYYGGPTE